MNLDEALEGVTTLGIDTAPIIYFIEAHPAYDRLVTQVFRRIDEGVLNGVTSVVALTEVLVHPIQEESTELCEEYRNVLLQSAHFQTLVIDIALAERAAELRVRYNLRTPDALQIAAALSAGCEAFLTNDRTLQRVSELRILLLDELEAAAPPPVPPPGPRSA